MLIYINQINRDTNYDINKKKRKTYTTQKEINKSKLIKIAGIQRVNLVSFIRKLTRALQCQHLRFYQRMSINKHITINLVM